MNLKRTSALLALTVLAATAGAATNAQAAAPYWPDVQCSYSATSAGWAKFVGTAPKGTKRVVWTLRTGTPEGWGSVEYTARNRGKDWLVTTGAGEGSYVNWITFVDRLGQVLASENTDVKCDGTPADWPTYR